MSTSATGSTAGHGIRTDDTQGTMGGKDMKQVGDGARDAMGRAAAGAADLADKAKDAASQAADRISSTAHEAVDRVGDTASEYASQLADTRDQLLEDARNYIAEYPLRTLGIAALTGYVLGRMMR